MNLFLNDVNFLFESQKLNVVVVRTDRIHGECVVVRRSTIAGWKPQLMAQGRCSMLALSLDGGLMQLLCVSGGVPREEDDGLPWFTADREGFVEVLTMVILA